MNLFCLLSFMYTTNFCSINEQALLDRELRFLYFNNDQKLIPFFFVWNYKSETVCIVSAVIAFLHFWTNIILNMMNYFYFTLWSCILEPKYLRIQFKSKLYVSLIYFLCFLFYIYVAQLCKDAKRKPLGCCYFSSQSKTRSKLFCRLHHLIFYRKPLFSATLFGSSNGRYSINIT